MECNHEYKGFLGCFPDIIGAHKVGPRARSPRAADLDRAAFQLLLCRGGFPEPPEVRECLNSRIPSHSLDCRAVFSLLCSVKRLF